MDGWMEDITFVGTRVRELGVKKSKFKNEIHFLKGNN